jgi:23S rRNA (uracil1939-C5)-methyltransferase
MARDATGRTVFIEDALPGDRVLVELTSQRKSHARGRVVTLIESEIERRPPPCEKVALGCGGCQWQHLDLDVQLDLKATMVRDALGTASGHPVAAPRTVARLGEWDFRTTVRAGVVDGRAGFRRLRSHEVIRADGCMTAHPALRELLDEGRFDGASGVLLRCGARTGERFVATVPSGVAASVPDDVRFDVVHEFAAGRLWRISGSSFFQSRPDGVDALAEIVGQAADQLSPGAAVDLFSGVGLFAGVLASRGWSVVAVESSRSAVGDAVVNVGHLGVRTDRADVNSWSPSRAELVVADPSRTGLDEPGVRVVSATGASRLVLVSCDVLSLRRDLRLLAAAGYRLTEWNLVDLFPHTSHVEVVSVFDRA